MKLYTLFLVLFLNITAQEPENDPYEMVEPACPSEDSFEFYSGSDKSEDNLISSDEEGHLSEDGSDSDIVVPSSDEDVETIDLEEDRNNVNDNGSLQNRPIKSNICEELLNKFLAYCCCCLKRE